MKNKDDMIKWLTALKADIGQGQYQGLWHYAEILDVVVKYLEVSEPVHGEWLHEELIPNTVEGHVHGECSVCHAVRIVDNYCPNCGCAMTKE